MEQNGNTEIPQTNGTDVESAKLDQKAITEEKTSELIKDGVEEHGRSVAEVVAAVKDTAEKPETVKDEETEEVEVEEYEEVEESTSESDQDAGSSQNTERKQSIQSERKQSIQSERKQSIQSERKQSIQTIISSEIDTEKQTTKNANDTNQEKIESSKEVIEAQAPAGDEIVQKEEQTTEGVSDTKNTAEETTTDSPAKSNQGDSNAVLPISQTSVDKEQEQVSPPKISFIEETKKESVSNTLKEIISDIDSNIREQERVAQLKQEEVKLLQKQQQLAQQIREQQILADKLASQNLMMQHKFQEQQQKLQQNEPSPMQHKFEEQEKVQQNEPAPYQWQEKLQQNQPAPYQWQEKLQQNEPAPYQWQEKLQQNEPAPMQEKFRQTEPAPYQWQQNQLQRQEVQSFKTPQTTVTKYSTHEESRDGDVLTKRTESYETKESSNVSKQIDLQKIFTPAADAEEILPKNRKLYASSAFYTPGLHPTVEDQVELARRISNSLSDISNHQSKGQSMYVNRKKRSVKWVHEAPARVSSAGHEEYYDELLKENNDDSSTIVDEIEEKRTPLDKIPLRLLMNPRGQVRDYSSLRETLNTESGLLSPEKCAELVHALQTQKGRGAELFAKRRKKSDKWVVDETTTSTDSPSGLPDYHPYQAPPPKPPTSPSIVPAYSDAGKHRVQLNIQQEQAIQKHAKPGLKVVKSPWEAALEDGSASAAFVEDNKLSPHHYPVTPTPSPVSAEPYYKPSPPSQQTPQVPKTSPYNDYQRDLAYKPSLPQGWKAASVSLPKESCEEATLEEDCGKIDTLELNKSIPKSSSSSPCYSMQQEFKVEAVNYDHEQKDDVEDRVLKTVADNFSYGNNMENEKTGEFKNKAEILDEESTDLQSNTQRESYGRVDVRRQLEQFERQQMEIALRNQYEESVKMKRNGGDRSWKWQQTTQKNAEVNQTMDERAEDNGAHTSTEQEPTDNDYVKVAVRDLIESFEQQAVLEEPTNQNNLVAATEIISLPPCDEQNWSDIEEKELYLPKEIPLESYAPPPTVNINPTKSYSGFNKKPQQPPSSWGVSQSPSSISSPYTGYSCQQPTTNNTEYNSSDPPSCNFPIANKRNLRNDYESGAGGNSHQFPIASTVPPKQQYWDPKSYQKVPAGLGAQKPSQVSFNPSPLPYDKLAKFEGYEHDENQQRQYGSPQQRYLTPASKPRVGNRSPTPFGGQTSPSHHQAPAQHKYFPPSQGDYYQSSPPAASMTSPQLTAKELLHGQNFNNAARGWQPSNRKAFCTKPRVQLTSVGDIPYSDF